MIETGRGLKYKVFDNEDGTFTYKARSRDIHYFNASGNLVDIDQTFVDMGTYWEMDKHHFRLRVAKNFSDPQLIQYSNRSHPTHAINHIITFEPRALYWVDLDDQTLETRTLISQDQNVTGVLQANGTEIQFLNAFGSGIHYRVAMTKTGFRKEIVFMNAAAAGSPPYTNWGLVPLATYEATGVSVKAINLPSNWDQISLYRSNDEFDLTGGGVKSHIRRAYIYDTRQANGDINRRRLDVYFLLANGKLWQGKVIRKSDVQGMNFPVYADTTTSYYAGSEDGTIREDHSTWATGRGNSTGDTVFKTDGTWGFFTTSQYASGPGLYRIERGILPFDLSGLSASADVTDVDLKLYGDSLLTELDDAYATVVFLKAKTGGGTGTLVVGDFGYAGEPLNPGASDIFNETDHASLSTGSYNTFVFDSDGIAHVESCAGGNCYIGMREGHDAHNQTPGSNAKNTYQFTGSEYTGTTRDPELVVVYSLSTLLVVPDLSLAHTLEAPALTQKHLLTVAELLLANGFDGISLTQKHILILESLSHATAVDNIDLVAAIMLAVADMLSGHTLDAPTLTQKHSLIVGDLASGHTIDGVDLTQKHLLTVLSMLSDHTLDPVSLVQKHTLAVQEMLSSHSFEEILLAQKHLLAVGDMSLGHSMNNLDLLAGLVLVVADMANSLTLENIDVTQKHVLVLSDLLSPTTLEALAITQKHTITVGDLLLGHTIDPLVLDVSTVLAVQGLLHSQGFANIDLTQKHVLVLNDLLHTTTADNILLVLGGVPTSPLSATFTATCPGMTASLSLNDITATFSKQEVTFSYE